jgi:hypothetical protein
MTAQTPPGSPNDLIAAAPEGRFDGVRRPYHYSCTFRLRCEACAIA